jgi:hypothetical protein
MKLKATFSCIDLRRSCNRVRKLVNGGTQLIWGMANYCEEGSSLRKMSDVSKLSIAGQRVFIGGQK